MLFEIIAHCVENYERRTHQLRLFGLVRRLLLDGLWMLCQICLH